MIRAVILLISATYILSVLSTDNTKDAQGEDFHWNYCSDYSGDYFKVNHFQFMFSTHKKNLPNCTALVNADLYRTIEWGTIHFTMKYELNREVNVTVIDEYLNFCDMWVDITNQYCPIKPGSYNMSKTLNPPSIFPKGKYYGRVSVSNKGEEYACMDIKISF